MPESDTKKKIIVVSHDKAALKKIRSLKMDFPVEFSILQESYELLKKLRNLKANLFILDFNLPLISGEELVKIVHDSSPDVPIITIVSKVDAEMSKAVINAGTYDYITHPVDADELQAKIQNLLFSEAYHFHVASLRDKIKDTFGLDNIIGDCDEMWKVFHSVHNISKSNVTVFISGESGTGKELLARVIYHNSLRRNNPLIIINCAAIPENLLESELFGHEKGSFSGAINKRIGKFELADKGTIFLDEIAEMSVYMQSKILRVLEEQEFERVGGNTTIKVDVRIITATNKILEEEVKEDRFREDLFYRINVYPINLPPLRQRVDDIPLLVFFFLKELSERNNKEVVSITETAMERLKRYPWPGNIRELENVMERAILNCPSKVLTVEEFNHLDGNALLKGAASADAESKVYIEESHKQSVIPLKEVEKHAIENALSVNEGNISSAARQLAITRARLYRKIKEFDIRFDAIS